MTSRTTTLGLLVAVPIAFAVSACSDDLTRPSDGAERGSLHAAFAKPDGNGGGKGGGKGGGGTEPYPATVTMTATANLMDDGKGDYIDGTCGVQAQVGSTIAYFKPDGRALKGKERNCGGRAATVVVDGTLYDLISLKARLDSGTLAPATVNVGRCEGGLQFDPAEIPGSNDVTVTPNADNTAWVIRSQPYPDNVVGCLANGSVEFFHMEIDVTFVKN